MKLPSPIFWQKSSASERENALARPALADSASVKKAVSLILSEVRSEGDVAICRLTEKFDQVRLTHLKLEQNQITEIASTTPANVKTAIDLAYDNIHRFHAAQFPKDIKIETQPGVLCEQKHSALEKVGLYIPGGTAPLPSTVLMLGVSAQVAGCDRKILCTPPSSEGRIAAEILYAAQKCGITEVFMCGGAQAIAGMAYGTQSIPKVDKIFGPGNSFVTEAKQQVSQQAFGAAIDMPAGPSEVLVLADKHANQAFVAADLLSQAEHGSDSQAILVCDDGEWTLSVQAEINKQLAMLNRKSIAEKAMNNSRFIVTDDIEQAIDVTNLYAAEHLIIQTKDAEHIGNKVKNAGSIFVGPYSPESAGDYASGTNHVLPTYGFARNYSSLGLLDFMRRYTVQTISQQGLVNISSAIVNLAMAEGLDAHANAVSIRLKQDANNV
ncbi:histidinol dehydrogenase [Glaciecola petra]|uniref:Histidinol dehydrogenase n=1 Tax=Glaciecola petra TaxID=3075602 RepID=A0ABU2ZQ33_9ALTE|nr:histidinol dehydrogenase [Aestuariibacter sp. P117]MDT0594734.1 histidinol dehydrogenase [Aestuariibacter sp. P117]